MVKKGFWKIEKRKVADLKDFKQNPRVVSKKQYELLKSNILKYGLIDRPFINVDGTIIGGHLRTQILQEIGFKEIEVFVAPRKLTEDEVKELCVKHNRISGEWDFDSLANNYDFSELLTWGFEERELIEEVPTGKRKTKPKYVIEFQDADDLLSFVGTHNDEIMSFLDRVTAKVKIKGVEDST